MAVAWASSTTAPEYFSQSLPLTTDTGTSVGDLLYAVIAIQVNPAPTVTATGWTASTAGPVSLTGDVSGYVFWRYANQTGAAAHTFTWGTSAIGTGVIHRFTGAAPGQSDPAGGSMVATVATSTTLASQSYTTLGSGLGVWMHGSRGDNNIITVPSGYTNQTGTMGYSSLAVADRADTAGAKTTGTGTTSVGWGPSFIFAGTLQDVAVPQSEGSFNTSAISLMRR